MMQPELRRILEASLGSLGLRRRLKEVTAVLAWPEVVGSELARRTHARYLQGGILFVGTAGPAWSHQLSLMRPSLIAKLNAQLGEKIVTDIRFSVGLEARAEVAATLASPRTPLPDAPLAPAIAEAAADLPEDLREAFLRLGRSQSRLAAARLKRTPTRCRSCGQPTGSDSDLCPVCETESATVRRLKVRAALAQNSALSWNDAAEQIPGLSPLEYRAEHDALLTDLWNALGRARDAADPDAIRQAACKYLACKYSKPEAAVPEDEVVELARVPVSRSRAIE
ncbi:MAG: DciA family protein [Chloroflexota bacterium]